MLNALFVLIFGLGVALYEAPIYALTCIAYFPVIFLTVGFFGKKVKDVSAAKMAMSKTLGSVVEENLSAIKLIVSFAQESRACRMFSEAAAKMRKITHKSDFLISILTSIIRIESFIFFAYTIWVAAAFIKDKKINHRTGKVYTAGEVLAC